MELRSSRHNDDYKKLQLTLNGMGFYEEGMELQEMRQIMDALQMSATECETNFLASNMQQALRESELNFIPTQDVQLLNSTMMSTHHNISPSSSTNISSEIIVVQAEVHHAMDWSPPKESLPFASPNMAVDMLSSLNPNSEREIIKELLEPDVKAAATIANHDTETTIVEQSTNSTENSNNLVNCLHMIPGVASEHRINDSGFIMSYEASHSPFNNTSSNFTQSSSASLNNLENPLPVLSNSIHEILGPVSVRRIHDSGVNVSTEEPQTSVVNNSYENSSFLLENSTQVSTSSAVNQQDFGDVSESSL